MTPLLEVGNLTVSYDREPVLRAVGFSCPPGAVVGVVGPNGAGKSTLLKAVLGLVPRESGEVRVAGTTVERARDRIAYVPQREDVDWDFPVTALDVVLMGRYHRIGLFRRPGPDDRSLALSLLERVGLSEFANARIGELSGGQQQRVFVARALAREADLIFLDEPFVGVDAATERIILKIMAELRDAGRTIVIVNHDLSVVQEHYDRVLLLNGAVVAYGPPAEVFRPDLLRLTYGGRLVAFEQGGRQVVARP
ncbi:MAG TPA: metal ABC transporter ATP-binding protein [Bacillota bacterium]